jgi:site-specific DNA-methyltransferase (adenine-specific)
VIDLRCGDWRDVLADVEECDALIVDPPYGARTHAGHDAGVNGHIGAGKDSATRRQLNYAAWTPADVREFVEHWSPRTRGWFCAMTSHDLIPVYYNALEAAGRYVFAPVPCVIRAMTVRLGGDGPSSWAVYMVVARPKTREFATWGTLPGAYVVNRDPGHIGGKPRALMELIVRDYSRPGDLVVDPCAGMGTTLRAAELLGRRAIGAEVDPATHAKAIGQAPWEDDVPQRSLFGGGQ